MSPRVAGDCPITRLSRLRSAKREGVADACFAVLQMDRATRPSVQPRWKRLADALDAVDYQPASEEEPEEDDGADSTFVLD